MTTKEAIDILTVHLEFMRTEDVDHQPFWDAIDRAIKIMKEKVEHYREHYDGIEP